MLFVQFRFLVFFLIVFCVHWALRTNQSRKIWLLIASHFFFACFFLGGVDNPDPDELPAWTFISRLVAGEPLPKGWWFPVVMWTTTSLDFVSGRMLGRTDDPRARRGWLWLSVCVNLGVLGFFKYINFGVASAGAFLAWLGFPTSEWTLNILLPTGISFYTFQSLSYTIDGYRRRLAPIESIWDYAFYIAFFPQLVAGPIVRAATFLPQVFVKRRWDNVAVRACLVLFLIGFVKKACLSDNIAPVVDAYFSAPAKYDLYSSFIGILYYAIQVYCDFSGYTDMAMACAGLLAYELTPNFDFPYFSPSISDFWRRWHISLGTWLRDYLYIPLGGNRGSQLFAFRNMMLTMLLGGLWHGASWNFVIWGGINGIALTFHRHWQDLVKGWGPTYKAVMGWLSVPITFYTFLVTLVFVRARDVYDASGALVLSGTRASGQVLKAICLFDADGKDSFTIHCLWLFVIVAAVHYANYRRWLSHWWRRIPYWAFAALIGIGFAAALVFVPARYKPFIYFQF